MFGVGVGKNPPFLLRGGSENSVDVAPSDKRDLGIISPPFFYFIFKDLKEGGLLSFADFSVIFFLSFDIFLGA